MEKFCRVNIRSKQSLLLPPLTVHLKQGNILSSDCDVIVNTTGKDFNLTGKCWLRFVYSLFVQIHILLCELHSKQAYLCVLK